MIRDDFEGSAQIWSRTQLNDCGHWKRAFAGQRKDRRYFELVEDSIQGFEYWYFAIRDRDGVILAIQPFFILDQDLLVGVKTKFKSIFLLIRRLWPRFLMMRTLMVGCAAGEGHMDGEESSYELTAKLLAAEVVSHARALKATLVVLKEFPARYRHPLRWFLRHNFRRVPSLPMTRLGIDYPSFDAYMAQALNSSTRRKLRKKFNIAAASGPIELSVVDSVASIIEEIYPLYLQVYSRSKLHFEMLTKEYLSGIGGLMPDKTRFFLWRQNDRLVAFTLCLLEGEAIYAEYIGLDYPIAINLHLYHYAVRDMISWAISHGYKSFHSSGLNYDPKLHMRHSLDPVDLYVRHTSPIFNAILKRVLPFIEPTRYDPVLKKFPNFAQLWDS